MNLQLTILRNLKSRHPNLMTTATLWAEVSLDEPKANYTGFKAALGELEEKGQALVIQGEDREKAKITDEGIARLLE